MAEFWPWLASQSDRDPAVAALKAFAAANAAAWPAASDDLADYRQAVAAHPPGTAEERDRLQSTLGQCYERWFRGRARKGSRGKRFGYVALILTGLVIAVFLGVAIFGGYLKPLAEAEQARGLITFLFTFATIAIAVVLSLSLLWMDKDELEERFKFAKDLLMILVGILGTIIGFYFGATEKKPPEAQSPPAASSPVSPAPKT